MTRKLLAIIGLVIGLVLGGARPAMAELSAAQRAQPRVDAAQAAFNERDYETALREFRAARELVEEPMLTYNIALCQERLGELPDAIESYNRYLREAPEAENAQQVRNHIEDLHRQRVEERDAALEVEDAERASRSANRLEVRAQRTLDLAHHELDVVIGAAVTIAEGIRQGAGSTGFNLEFDYHYRITPTWHVGGGFIYDSFYSGDEVTNGSNHRQYGGLLSGRYARRLLDGRIELRATAAFGYEFLKAHLYPDRHWVYLRAGGDAAWAIVHGFGIHLRLAFRFGFLAGGNDADKSFGGTFDATIGVFWAF
jgi:tetratricopeptide (TPR) repeat protein